MNAYFILNNRRSEGGGVSLVELKAYCEIIKETDVEFMLSVIEIADEIYLAEREAFQKEKEEFSKGN